MTWPWWAYVIVPGATALWILIDIVTGRKRMNARQAQQRQRLIENTLAGLKAMLCDDKTLLQEMDPQQEQRFRDLITLAALAEYHDL